MQHRERDDREPAAGGFQALFETMPIGVVYQAADGRITRANPAAERILGLSLAEMQGRTSTDPRWRAVHRDGSDFPGDEHPAMVALRTGERVSGVVMGVSSPADADQRWIRVDATPVFDPGETTPSAVYTTLLDITAETSAEAARRAEASRFRSLFDAMNEGVAYCRMLFDADDRPDDFVYEWVNPAFARLTGLEDAEGRRVSQVIPGIKAETPELLETYGRVARTGEPAEFDIDFTPLGIYLHIKVYRPEPDHFVAVFENVTEHRKMVAALAASRRELSALVDTIPEVTFSIDSAYRLITANTAFVDAVAAARGSPIAKGESVLSPDYPPEFLALWRELYDRVLAGESLEAETRIPMEDGLHIMENHLHPIRAADDAVTGVVVMSRDVTERRRSEEALRQSEARLRLAQEAAKAGTWEWDLETGENTWSPELWRLYGYEPFDREACYDTWLASILPEDRERAAASVNTAAVDGTELNVEWRVATQDGSLRWLMSRGRPEFDDDGRVASFRGIVIDITERVQAAEEVRRLNADLERRVEQRTVELERATAELQGFVYSISHDLRTPLRTIGSYSQILLQDHAAELGGDAADALRRIERANARMVRLVDGLLELAGLSRGRLKVQTVDVSRIVAEVGEEIRDGAPDREVELTVADGLTARADEALLRVVFYDLLGNAWKFTAGRRPAHIEVGADGAGGETAFYVRDDGAGFDQRFVDKLFTPFERLHDDTEFAGTGIGLATVRRIVERHGGRVWAEGEVGAGATFYFTLP